MPESYQKIGLDAIKSVDEHICRILSLLNTVVKSYKLRWNTKNKGLDVENVEVKCLSHELTTPKTFGKKKGVVGTNLLRLLKFGGPSQT